MVKTICLFGSMLWIHTVSGFENLPTQYHIQYGDPSAPIRVVEYISISCPKCLELYRKDFAHYKESYVASKKIFWVFHPDPADLLTLQALVCLEKLTEQEKRIFWEVLLENVEPGTGSLIMKAAMESFGKPIPELDKLEFLDQQKAFEETKKFLQQPGVIEELPTVQINGKLYDAFPSRKFLEKTIALIEGRRSS